ncbi:MAG: hypothetical protein H0T78_04245 [Longispora sp.]|nr:hypothetical protein [Longispora sp. (in: high G+C Gram-positive bacteria)]
MLERLGAHLRGGAWWLSAPGVTGGEGVYAGWGLVGAFRSGWTSLSTPRSSRGTHDLLCAQGTIRWKLRSWQLG